MKKLSVSFPQLEPDFFNVLAERLKVNGFSDQRLKDAVGWLLDNFEYPKPSVANIVSFDKRVKMYNHIEAQNMVTSRQCNFSDFYPHWVGNTLYRVLKSDADLYGLTKFLNHERPTADNH